MSVITITVSGQAGTGKTTIINSMIEFLTARGVIAEFITDENHNTSTNLDNLLTLQKVVFLELQTERLK